MKGSSPLLGILTGVLVVALIIVSYYGAFVPGIYAYENTSFAVQGIGQDVFDLLIVVPVLLISLTLKISGSKTGYFVFGGSVLYTLYSFFIYSFGVHFNQLFLLYCIILGASLYTFILLIFESGQLNLKEALHPQAPVKTIGVYFISIALLFYALWLKDIIPALLTDSTPKDIVDNQLITNPVHVMDIAIMLPGLIFVAILLIRKHPIGILLTPFCLVFTILLAMALLSMVIMLNIKGINEDLSVAGIFVGLSVISLVLLFLFLKNFQIPKKILK